MQKITTFLWFENNAEELMDLYTSIFKDAKVLSVNLMGDDWPVLTAKFQLEG